MQVIFAVSDVERSAAFYENAFAWPRNPLVNFANYVEFLPPDGGAVGLYARDGYAGEVGAEPIRLENGLVSPAYVYARVDRNPAAREAQVRQLPRTAEAADGGILMRTRT